MSSNHPSTAVPGRHEAISTTPPPSTVPAAPDPADDLDAARTDHGAEQGLRTRPPLVGASEVDIDIFKLDADAALKLMCDSLETIMEMTGDVPPTPPPNEPATPNMRSIRAEKEETVRYHRASREGSRANTPPPAGAGAAAAAAAASDGVAELGDLLAQTIMLGGSNSNSGNQTSIRSAEADAAVNSVQHRTIIRKFYSKTPPPISLELYLSRLHRYCPMSPAVVLATSLYVHRLAVAEQVLSLTGRNVHRLLLGGVATAIKALEDIAYSHHRLAKVGGVSAAELSRLEVSFCFLANFDLKVDVETLTRHVRWLQSVVPST